MYKEIIQEEINNDYIGNESDFIFSANIVEGQYYQAGYEPIHVPHFQISALNVGIVKVESIGEPSLLVDDSETAVDSYTLDDTAIHTINVLAGNRTIKISRIDRVALIILQDLSADLNIVSGLPKFTNATTFGVGHISFIDEQIPVEGLYTKYAQALYLQAIPGDIGTLSNCDIIARLYQNHCKACFGDISCFANNDKFMICFLRNNSVTGDVENFANSIKWQGENSGNPAMMIDGSLIYGSLDNLFDKWVAKHMESKTLYIGCNGIVTLNGTPVNGHVIIEVTKDTGWTLVERT